jgi:GT2 family glycosyltransferase
MNNEPKTAIIVLNWNGYEDTVECFDSLRKTDYRNYKVILVDNDSDNEEGQRLKQRFQEVHLIQNKSNRGFAGGNNDGINWALKNDFDYIVNLNNDCLVEPDWLTQLINGISEANADFGSSRIMFYPEKDIIYSDGDVLMPDGTGRATRHLQKYSRDRSIIPIFSACGAGSIYSRQCLKEVRIKKDQYFDELYFAYFEDLDLGMRLNAKGFKGVSVQNAVVYHKCSRTAGSYSYFNRFLVEKNRLLNVLLDFPLIWWIPAELFYWIKPLIRLFKCGDSGNHRHDYIESIGIVKTMSALIKARWWIVINLGSIISNRAERKSKKMIDPNIYRNFDWSFGP